MRTHDEINYVEQIRSQLATLLPTCHPVLLDLYTLLGVQYGEQTDLVMVHNAWSVWCNRSDPQHRSLIPFPFLAHEVQELDRPYMDAIHQAVRAAHDQVVRDNRPNAIEAPGMSALTDEEFAAIEGGADRG